MEIIVGRKEFEKFLEAIKKVSEEAKIDIKKKEMQSITVDPSHIFLVKAKCRCEAEEELTIAINVEKLYKLLKIIKDEYLTMEVEASKLWINRKIGVGLLDNTVIESPKEPSLEFEVKTNEFDFEELKKIISTGKTISDIVKFIAQKGNLSVKIEGDTDVLDFTITSVEGEGKAMYSIEILNELLRGLDRGTIEFKTDYPLRITSDNEIYVQYLIAPRIEG